MLIRSIDEAPSCIVPQMEANDCRCLVLGIEEDAVFGQGGDGGLPLWAVSNLIVGSTRHACMLVKGRSKVRPFTVVNTPRTFCVLIDHEDLANQTFLAALAYVRPGDSMELLYMAPNRQPLGDCREDRFGMGLRVGWVAPGSAGGASASASASEEAKSFDPANVANSPGWNDQAVNQLTSHMQSLLAAAHIPGSVLVEYVEAGRTSATALCQLALKVDADVIVASKRLDIELCVDIVQESPCSVLLL
jgi:nucleotide-binding universal stress UspA family protein